MAFISPGKVVLGSSSPRRRDLLSLLIAESRIDVVPPQDSSEAGFDDAQTQSEIHRRILEIAQTKLSGTLALLEGRHDWSLVMTADTVVVGEDGDQRAVLGKPDGPDWQGTVRNWFDRYYWNRTHTVVTGVCLQDAAGRAVQFLATTTVKMREKNDELLTWYLGTAEPLGKAGGYGLQGAGSLFVDAVCGSSTNVVGLPLEPLREVLRDWHVLQ